MPDAQLIHRAHQPQPGAAGLKLELAVQARAELSASFRAQAAAALRLGADGFTHASALAGLSGQQRGVLSATASVLNGIRMRLEAGEDPVPLLGRPSLHPWSGPQVSAQAAIEAARRALELLASARNPDASARRALGIAVALGQRTLPGSDPIAGFALPLARRLIAHGIERPRTLLWLALVAGWGARREGA